MKKGISPLKKSGSWPATVAFVAAVAVRTCRRVLPEFREFTETLSEEPC